MTLPLEQVFWETKNAKIKCQDENGIEWEVQNGPITKKTVLPLIFFFFFWKFDLSIGTSYNVATTQMFIFILFISALVLFEVRFPCQYPVGAWFGKKLLERSAFSLKSVT